ncbi:MAG: hypothetical protein KKE04_03190 [Candidatus Thermoplasmatota archaeon]|nr:hypothetical protein [Candidatus Thermoplasmatota archaeon]
MIWSNSVTVERDINTVYDFTLQYFTSLEFKTKNCTKPTRLILERGSVMFADVGVLRDKWKTKKCELEVNLVQSEKSVLIKCDYYVPWVISSKGRDLTAINDEIEGLKNFVVTQKNKEECTD